MRFQRGASGIRCSRKVCSVKYLSGQKLYYTERIWCLHACCSYIARHSRRLRPRNNARGSGTAAAASLTTISKDLLIQRRAHERARGAEFRWGRGGRRGGSDRIVRFPRAESERRSIIEGVTSSQGHGSGDREGGWQSFFTRKIYFLDENVYIGPWESTKKISSFLLDIFPFTISIATKKSTKLTTTLFLYIISCFNKSLYPWQEKMSRKIHFAMMLLLSKENSRENRTDFREIHTWTGPP